MQLGERGPGLRVAFSGKQLFGTSELQLESVRAGRERRAIRQAFEREVGGGRKIAQRKFVIRAGERGQRLVEISSGYRGHAHPNQHIVGRRGFGFREPLVDRQRGGMFAERLV